MRITSKARIVELLSLILFTCLTLNSGQAVACDDRGDPDTASELDTKELRDVFYGTDRNWHRLNLTLPAGRRDSVPLVIWIHGGAWVSGDKDNENPATVLIERGFAVASLEYRPATVAAFPAQLKDCEQAVRFLRSRARKYQIDPDRIGVWGASAGGHLAALLGVHSGKKRNSANVQAVCDWCGPADLVNAIGDSPKDCPLNIGEVLWRLFLGPAAGNQALRNSINPAQRKKLLASGSPIEYVSGKEPPILIVHGDADKTVPLIQSQRFYERLNSAGADVSLHVVRGGQHRLFDYPESSEQAVTFFERTLNAAMPEETQSAP